MKRFCTVLMMGMTSSLWALKEVPWISHGKTSLDIAKDQVTRIALQDDRIANVMGGGAFDLESDPDTGQIFIKPHPDSKKTISLTLISESGQTHDLSLTPKDQESQSVLFVRNTPSQTQNPKPEEHALEHVYTQRNTPFLEKMRAVMRGDIPKGCVAQDFGEERAQEREGTDAVSLSHRTSYVCADTVLHIYDVHLKEGQTPGDFSEEDFARTGDLMLSFNDNQVQLLVVRSLGEGA